MNVFTHDFVYRLADKQRSRAMATRMTPAGRFWTTYGLLLVIVISYGLAILTVAK